MSPPAGSPAAGAKRSPVSPTGHARLGVGHEAEAQRARDPALAVEVDRVGDRRGGRPRELDEQLEVRGPEARRVLVRHAEHAVKPRAELRAGARMKQPIPSVLMSRPSSPDASERRCSTARRVQGHLAHRAPIQRQAALVAAHAEREVHPGRHAQLPRPRVEPGEERLARPGHARRLAHHLAMHLLGLERGGHRLGRAPQPQLVAGAPRLGVEQGGPLDGKGGQLGHHLHGTQVRGLEGAARVDGGEEQHAERPPGGAGKAPGHHGGGPQHRPDGLRGPAAQESGRRLVQHPVGPLPGLNTRQEERALAAHRGGHEAVTVRGGRGPQRIVEGRGGEPAGQALRAPALRVHGHEGHGVHRQQRAHVVHETSDGGLGPAVRARVGYGSGQRA